MKALGIVMIVLGVLALGVFGVVQFRTIGVNERAIEKGKQQIEEDGLSPGALDTIAGAKETLDTARTVRTLTAIAAPLLIVGGVMVRRRARA